MYTYIKYVYAYLYINLYIHIYIYVHIKMRAAFPKTLHPSSLTKAL